MKYITFKSLFIKNFLSVGDTPVKIDFNTGLNIITGINKDKVDRRNGVGKSTIADALYFSVFGDTLRDLKKEHITNNVTHKKCEIVLTFNITDNNQCTEYKIIRLLEPTKCFLYEDGDDVTRDSIANTNLYISSLLCSSAEVFQNCIIMTINNTIPFMAKKKIEKRKFIEGILNLEVFGRMLNTLRTEHHEIMRTFDSECTRYEEISNSLQTYRQQKTSHDKHIEDQLAQFKSRLDHNINQIKTLGKQLDEKTPTYDVEEVTTKINTQKGSIEMIDEKLQTLTGKISKIQTTIEYNEKLYKKIGTEDSTCPVCLKAISDHDKGKIKEEKTQINNDIISLTDKLSSHREKYKEAQNVKSTLYKSIESKQAIINDLKLNESSIANIKSRVDELNIRNDEIKNDIKTIDNKENQFDQLIETTEDKIKLVQTEINNIKKLLHTLDVVNFVISEEGVKSYIVKKILQLLNSKLAYYLKKMDSNCICVFNEYFEDQIIDEKGKVCSYFNFSGAERKNIDLACLFAFMDIRRLQGDVAFNFSIYDELFDSSLDEKGVELVLGILKERIEKYNECIMVISHRKESSKLATGEIIFLQKDKGITTRVDPTLMID
jgi:DNA repair exonuclease SbcCD ATPase subunit